MLRAIAASMFVALLTTDASAEIFVILRRDTPLFVAPDPAARTVRGSRKDSAELARWRLVARNDAFASRWRWTRSPTASRRATGCAGAWSSPSRCGCARTRSR